MGAGKSTVGRLLARKMRWDFLDVDTYIEASAGATAEQLFAKLGNIAFRNLESDAFACSLQRSQTVIAVGGAAIDMPTNQTLLATSADSLVVFLDAPFASLIERCVLQERNGGATYRPLLHQTELARARLTVDVSERTPDQVALLIRDAIGGPEKSAPERLA
jgi:shikimate kinase